MNVASFARCLLVAVLALGAPGAHLPADAPAGPLEQRLLRVGIPRVAFGNLNENDATAAFTAFLRSAGRKFGCDLRPEVSVYDTLSQLERAIRAGHIHMVVISPWQLVSARLDDALDIEFVPVVNGDTTNRVLLLAHRDSGATDLAALRGKSVVLLRNSSSTLSLPWLETLCLAAGLGFPQHFFSQIETIGKPNAAILPVFFGRAGACLVDERSFELACELNPQLRADLVIVERSEPVLIGVIGVNRIGWQAPRHRDDVLASLAELHLDPAGQQILTLFRIDRLAPFDPARLQSVAALAALHARLVERLARSGDHPAAHP